LIVAFDDSEPYVGNRPYTTVLLRGPGGTTAAGGRYGTAVKFVALVDTGADYMQLPTEAAINVGLGPALATATRSTINTAGGVVTRQRLLVDLEVRGIRVNVPTDFGPGAYPLLGRQALFAAIGKAGFTTSDWLIKR
jgi:predicted aspartyl protease